MEHPGQSPTPNDSNESARRTPKPIFAPERDDFRTTVLFAPPERLALQSISARPHESRRLTTKNTAVIVQHITSPLVTSAHIDVTFQPIAVAYASPKHFVFPSKRQLYWMDANRWVRQRIKESKVTSVSELGSISCSINNIGKPVNASIRLKRTRTESMWLTINNAFHRLRFTTKTLR
jgi:hypothetical protein